MAATGCEMEDRPFAADVRFSPTPPVEGDNRLVVTLEDRVEDPGAPLEGARVRVTRQPPGEAEAAATRELDAEEEGRYVADPFPFPDAGEWDVSVQVILADGTDHTLESRVRVVSAPPSG